MTPATATPIRARRRRYFRRSDKFGLQSSLASGRVAVCDGVFRLLVGLLVTLDQPCDRSFRHPHDEPLRDLDLELVAVQRLDHAVEPAGRHDLVSRLEARDQFPL